MFSSINNKRKSWPNCVEVSSSASKITKHCKCSHKTATGNPCNNYVRHTYDGKDVCDVHLAFMKAREDCCCCLEPMDKPWERVKLDSCGHTVHITCLGKCVKPQCPLCSTPFTPKEAVKFYNPTRIAPFFEKVYAMPQEKVEFAFYMFEKISKYINKTNIYDLDVFDVHMDTFMTKTNGMSTDKVDFIVNATDRIMSSAHNITSAELPVFNSAIDSYFFSMANIKSAAARYDNPLLENPGNVMMDILNVGEELAVHVSKYTTYEGMTLLAGGSKLEAYSTNPNVVVSGDGLGFVPGIPYVPPPYAGDVVGFVVVEGDVDGDGDVNNFTFAQPAPIIVDDGIDGIGGIGDVLVAQQSSPTLFDSPASPMFIRSRSPSPVLPWYYH
jgi:hypothetical protein